MSCGPRTASTHRLSPTRRRALRAGFARLKTVHRHLGLDEDPLLDLFSGKVFAIKPTSLATFRYLRVRARLAAWHTAWLPYHEGHKSRELKAVRAIVYAYIMGTPIARSTVNRAFLVGGWCAQVALELMPRAK
jgi:hypothetical protein